MEQTQEPAAEAEAEGGGGFGFVGEGRVVELELAERDEEPVRQVRADVVLSNADFKRTLLDLVGPEHLPSEWLTRARDSKMAAALFMTFLGVKGDLRDDGMRATNYWQYDEFDFDAIYQDDPSRPPLESSDPG